MIFKDKDKDKIKEKATQPIFLEEQPERSFSMLQVRTAVEGCADECPEFEPVENRFLFSSFGHKVYFCKYTKGCEHALKCSKEQSEAAKSEEQEDKTVKVRDQLYLNGVYNALCEVSMYAYHRGCPGLSDAECRELENLVDKASKGILEYILKSEEEQEPSRESEEGAEE